MTSWWLRFLRDALIALVSTYAIYLGGLLLGLGVLIVFDVPGSEKFIGNHVSYLLLAVSIILFLTGKFLYGSDRMPVRMSGGALIIFAAALLGAWIGIEVQYFTVQHGVEDLGLYDGPGHAAVVASALLVQRSKNRSINRVGSIMVVLASVVVMQFVWNSIKYSRLVSDLHLAVEHRSMLNWLNLALILLVAGLTSAHLIRRSHQSA